jgi:hypothetical protein
MTDVHYNGRVRDRSPDTSWAAADQLTDDKVSQVAATIRVLLGSRGPLTQEQLVEAYDEYARQRSWIRPVTPQNIRTRAAELHHAGKIRDTGTRRPTRSGGSAAVWELVPTGTHDEATA